MCAGNSGAWGGYLVTNEAEDFATYMDIHANPQVLPLLLALMGPALHVCEAACACAAKNATAFGLRRRSASRRWRVWAGVGGCGRPEGA
jgi:hypothetical protein